MSASTQTIKTPEPKPTAPSTKQATPGSAPATAPVAAFWGDRFMFLFWLSCFFLLAMMIVMNALAAWLKR
jgi:hypothetical protein